MPLSAVTETTIARWIKQLGGSGKTIANKHGFLSGAFQAAVRAGVMASNPCQGRRLAAHPRRGDGVSDSAGVRACCATTSSGSAGRTSATWLVTTGMRFSEATALSAADIDANAKTCRINKAWKYSGDYRPEIGPPKTKKSIRTISLPPAALEVVDVTAPGFLLTILSRN